MNAALGTLPFLATLWLLAVLGANVLEESGAKIAAALKGAPVRRQEFASAPVRLRVGAAALKPMRANAEWRAAA